jgi:hypothetical protein
MDDSQYQDPNQQFFTDIGARIRDLEEKQRLIKDRVVLLGNSFVEERNKNFTEISEMKKTLLLMKEEHERMKEFLQRITEQLETVARKEELMILQRQFDLFRK